MMKLRPIIVDSNNVILAGNMRYKALLELGYKQVPDEYVRKADELTEDEKRRFIIADNVGFGQWDFEVLAVDWDSEELADWGLNVPDYGKIEIPDNEIMEDSESYDFLIQIKCSNEQFEKIIDRIKKIAADEGAEVNIS